MENQISQNIQADVNTIRSIPVISSILEVVCNTTGMGFAVVARVTDEQWVACAVKDNINFGLKPGETLELKTTICNEIRQHQDIVIIENVGEDEFYSCHPTPGIYGFQSYISTPIHRKDGSFFGTLCAIDPKPAKLKDPKVIGMFKLFADLIAFHLNAVEALALSEATLLEERKIAELREQFMAILGHDLRNPLTATSNAAELILQMPVDARAVRLASIIKNSSFRMNGLIENILDFARSHLGEGLQINRNPNEPVDKRLNEVIAELQTTWPNRKIETQFILAEPVNVDGKQIAQLFSNLLSNALVHGKSDTPVKVEAVSTSQEFKLSVCNAGAKIPYEIMDRLFQPFSQGKNGNNRKGLGLGLYIASEIARSHGGILQVSSTDEETTFTLKIPQTEEA